MELGFSSSQLNRTFQLLHSLPLNKIFQVANQGGGSYYFDTVFVNFLEVSAWPFLEVRYMIRWTLLWPNKPPIMLTCYSCVRNWQYQ